MPIVHLSDAASERPDAVYVMCAVWVLSPENEMFLTHVKRDIEKYGSSRKGAVELLNKLEQLSSKTAE